MKVKGFDAFVRKLKRLPVDVQREAKELIEDASDKIVNEAAQAAPYVTRGAGLNGNIFSFPTQGGLNVTIEVRMHYAPYVEFGTGTEVDVPDELKDYAYQFKGRGHRQVNIPARPFFFPAYFKHRDELVKALKKMIKENLNR